MNVNAPCGLQNLGNTCFVNVCVQWLVRTREIEEKLRESFEKARGARGSQPNDRFFLEFVDLLDAMRSPSSRGKTMSPARFLKFLLTKKVLRESNGHVQQSDFTELLFDLINLLHAGVSRPGDADADVDAGVVGVVDVDEEEKRYYELWRFSEFIALLNGVTVSEIVDPHSQEVLGTNAEIFSLLSLPLPPPPPAGLRIEDCFRLYAAPELLTGENAWFNAQRGQRQEVLKRIRFRRFPALLCVILQRFSSCGTRKKQDEVRFDPEIDLSDYFHCCCGSAPAARAARATPARYELYAVCSHFGDIHHGHYLLCMKNDERGHEGADASWTVFDDERVSRVTARDVFSSQASSSAYCLFYRRT